LGQNRNLNPLFCLNKMGKESTFDHKFPFTPCSGDVSRTVTKEVCYLVRSSLRIQATNWLKNHVPKLFNMKTTIRKSYHCSFSKEPICREQVCTYEHKKYEVPHVFSKLIPCVMFYLLQNPMMTFNVQNVLYLM
jgi:hypothetical protein